MLLKEHYTRIDHEGLVRNKSQISFYFICMLD